MPTPKSFVEDAPKSFVPDESPQSTAPTVTPTPGAVLRPLTERERFTMTYPVGVKGEGVGENLHNMAQNAGVGIFQGVDALVHPVRTLEGIAASIIPQPVLDWSKNQGREGELRKKQERGEELSKEEQEYLSKAEGFEGAQNPIQQVGEGMRRPGEFIPNNAGQALVFDAAGRLLGSGARTLKETSRKMREGVTGTGPRVTKDLAEKTAAENAKNATRTQNLNTRRAEADTTRADKVKEANRQAAIDAEKKTKELQDKKESDRKSELHEHFEKTKAVKDAKEVAQDAADRKVALERGVEHLDPEIKTDLEATEDKVNEQANKNYNELAANLSNEEAPDFKENKGIDSQGNPIVKERPFLTYLYELGTDALKGSDTETPIMKSLGSRIADAKGGTLTYGDIQGYRAEIGRELRKGTLPGDVFHAYKQMTDAIDTEMENIASKADQRVTKETGESPHYVQRQKAARAYYRNYAETFLDRQSPIRKALDATERGQTIRQFRGKDQSGVEKLAQFNPQLARRINTVRGYQSEAVSIKPKTVTKAEPTLPPKPIPVEPIEPKTKPIPPPRPPLETPVKKVELEDIRQAKGESAAKKENKARTGYAPIVSTGLFVDALRSAMQGQFEHAGVDVAARGLYEIGKQTYAALLRNPDVIRVITEPTARDIAQIPPELRGESLKGLIEQAKKQGIKVDPRISALAGASAVGPRTKELQSMRSQPIQ